MRIFKSIQEFNEARDSLGKLSFVPTMGNLHKGHTSLVDIAKQFKNKVIASIYVNKLQFNDDNDYLSYPKTLEADIELLQRHGCDYLLIPDDIILENIQLIQAPLKSTKLCGQNRPGHFDGVATVVYKLLQIVKPDMAYFGEKDFQQLQIVKKLVSVIGASINVIGCPIVREPSGLAMSSRNKRLYNNELKHASKIYQILKAVKQKFEAVPILYIRKWVQAQFENDPYINLEYFEISEVSTLESAVTIAPNKKYRAFVAVFIRDVRLIDNIDLN